MRRTTTRGTLWKIVAGGAGLQLAGASVLEQTADAESEVAQALGVLAAWSLIAAGSSVLFVGLVAFGVLLGLHVYRHERPA